MFDGTLYGKERNFTKQKEDCRSKYSTGASLERNVSSLFEQACSLLLSITFFSDSSRSISTLGKISVLSNARSGTQTKRRMQKKNLLLHDAALRKLGVARHCTMA